MDPEFLRIAREHFDPYRPSSGTEHVACLLYALARMTRPQVVVEYGSGYSTLWILKALSENLKDVRHERALLREKSLRLIEKAHPHVRLDESSGQASWDRAAEEAYREWFRTPGKACALDPGYHEKTYEPRLFSFDDLDADHPYLQQLVAAVLAIGQQDLFTLCPSQRFQPRSLLPTERPIDWAWNDNKDYREFFETVWPVLNPAGGLVIFHNVPALSRFMQDVDWMRSQRSESRDLEVLLLEEPHKLNQNGCAILRKTSEYRPRCERADPASVWRSMLAFVRHEHLGGPS